MFRARDGFQIVQCDLKTAEVYYAAALSKDSFLQRAFIENLDLVVEPTTEKNGGWGPRLLKPRIMT